MSGFRGFLGGIGDAIGRGLNRVESSFLDASEQSIFFGSRKQRESLLGGVRQVNHGAGVIKDGTVAHYKNMKVNRAARAAQDKSSAFYNDAIEALNGERKIYRDQFGQSVREGTSTMIGGGAEMAGAIGGYFAATDRRGMGMKRAGAIATRTGMVVGGSMAVGTGMRYATGGTFTENRKGERDIAGIPFV